jgi:hypothetical protein
VKPNKTLDPNIRKFLWHFKKKKKIRNKKSIFHTQSPKKKEKIIIKQRKFVDKRSRVQEVFQEPDQRENPKSERE